MTKSVLFISSLIGLGLGTKWVVKIAIGIAERFNLSHAFVGLAILAVGTDLPELAVSIGAAMRKSAGMSVGNIMGSNIFDTLVPIGLGGTISQISMESGLLRFDLPANLG